MLAATILYFLGVTWFQFKVPLAGLVQLSPEWTPLLTALWVIAITNAVNLIDGLDGLAAGVVAIASGALAVYGLHLQHLGNLPTDNIGPLIAVVTCGICLGFLPHNFHPAKIFMGDAGALLLGLLMAASTMLIGGRTAGTVGGVAARSGQTYFFFAPLFIPFFILGRAHRRHGLRLRPPDGQPDRVLHPGQEPPAPPAAAAGPRPPPQRPDPVGLDGPAVRLHPLPALHLERQRLHPLRRPGPRGDPLHPVPPVAPKAGRARARRRGARRADPTADPPGRRPRTGGPGGRAGGRRPSSGGPPTDGVPATTGGRRSGEL